jgi:heme O synthase-like polyprenyltransferase
MIHARATPRVPADKVRPLGIVPFGPVFTVVTVVILAALTFIFALWLTFVGILVSAIAISVLVRRSMRRFARSPALLGRQAIGVTGH